MPVLSAGPPSTMSITCFSPWECSATSPTPHKSRRLAVERPWGHSRSSIPTTTEVVALEKAPLLAARAESPRLTSCLAAGCCLTLQRSARNDLWGVSARLRTLSLSVGSVSLSTPDSSDSSEKSSHSSIVLSLHSSHCSRVAELSAAHSRSRVTPLSRKQAASSGGCNAQRTGARAVDLRSDADSSDKGAVLLTRGEQRSLAAHKFDEIGLSKSAWGYELEAHGIRPSSKAWRG